MELPGHGGHVVVLLVVLAFAPWVGLAARRPAADQFTTAREGALPDGGDAGPPARILATASLVAGTAHAIATPHHIAESPLYGAFFIVVTLGQFACAGALLGSGRHNARLLGLTLAANAAVLATWVVSRTAGLPVGPHRTPEAIGPIDLTAAVAEMVLLGFGAVWLTLRTTAPEPAPERVRSAFPS